MKTVRNLLFAVAAACVFSSIAATTCSAVVVGVFDASRAGEANLATGSFATQVRASTLSHFSGTTFATTPTLTSAFLSGVNVAIIASPKTSGGITPLSASEQTALLNFVKGGGTALLLADTYSSVSSSQSIVAPFGMTVVDDGLEGLQMGTIQNPSHPIFNGPFGVQSQIGVLGAGVFTNLGPYAASLAKMNSLNLPIVAAIERNAINAGSGRVLIYSDASLFADPITDGFFSEAETLYLNSFAYLIPEPSSYVMAAVGIFAVGAIGFKRRRKTMVANATYGFAFPRTSSYSSNR
jgi:hypothetical protein